MIQRNQRKAFSLVELVVVVLILGILAAVAAPKMFDTAQDARMSGTKQSLMTLRNAIEYYRSQNGSYPPAATLSTALKPYIKGPFPGVQMGANANSNVANSTQNPITTPETGGAGWAYNQSTGDVVVNDASYISW